MHLQRFFFFFLVAAFFLSSCDRERRYSQNLLDQNPATTPPNSSGQTKKDPTTNGNTTSNGGGSAQFKIRLLLFAAGNCEGCKKELPEMRDFLSHKFSSAKERILVSVHLIGGAVSGQQATQEYANLFGQAMNLPFTMKPDRFGRCYHRFFPPPGEPIPALVITTEDFRLVQWFKPEPLNLDDFEMKLKGALSYEYTNQVDSTLTQKYCK